MKTTRGQKLLAAALVGALTLAATGARAEDIDTRIGKLSFTHDFANGYPTKASIEKLYDERDFSALPSFTSGRCQWFPSGK